MAALTAGIVLAALLPFLPGRYDSLAAPVSVMSQIWFVARQTDCFFWRGAGLKRVVKNPPISNLDLQLPK